MLGKGLESLIPRKDENQKPGINNDELAKRRDDADDHKKKQLSGDSAHYIPKHEHIEQFSFPTNINEDFRNRAQGTPANQRPAKQEAIFHIEVEKIKPNPYQPRRNFDRESLTELAQSIREFGIIQPLVVTKLERETETGTDVLYQLVAGERRLMAAKIAGLERVPVIVRRIDLNRSKLEVALVENIQRSNLNPLEAARAYAKLQDEFDLTQREIAARVGKSRETVANTLRLLHLPLHIQEALAENKINESQARTLLAISDVGERDKAFANLLSGKVSVRALRDSAQKSKPVDPQQSYWEKRLEEKLGAPVNVMRRGEKGKMVVRFHSEDEWQGILERLFGESDVE